MPLAACALANCTHPTFAPSYQGPMPTVHITRRERFSAAHKLSRPDWSAEKNYATFGKCSNPNWHGHNYDLWVTVKGIPSTETGFVTPTRIPLRISPGDHVVELRESSGRRARTPVSIKQGEVLHLTLELSAARPPR